MVREVETDSLQEEIESLKQRIEKLKKIVMDYFTLGNEFARSSLITALKNI